VGKESNSRSPAAIELDKKMVEKLGDRCCTCCAMRLDHGIEARGAAAGRQPPRGRVSLSARYEAGSVLTNWR
jgi:chemotaxis protein histidine kinase CheA